MLPTHRLGRAQVWALAQSIAFETHSIHNVRVQKHVVASITDPDEATRARFAWAQHWSREGLLVIERQHDLCEHQHAADIVVASTFCHGNTPMLANCCPALQIFNGWRFKVSPAVLRHTQAVFGACVDLPAFHAAHILPCPLLEA